MSSFKDHLITALIVIFLLIGLFALDDSYEVSVLSAQDLDQLIAQANEDQKEVKHIRIAQVEAIKH